MKIRSVHIKNYKSLRNVSLEELGNLVILIGPNSSGKSNFLEILNRFFAEIDLTGMPAGIDIYSWFDCNQEEPIEISVTLKFDERECKEIFPPELLETVKEKFKEKYQEVFVCRQIIKAPTGWQTKSIKWAEIPLIEDGKPISIEELSNLLSIALIPLEELQAVFFDPEASNTNIKGDRLILVKSTKNAYFMGPYTDELVRSGKIKLVNVSAKTTDFRKYISEEGYTLIEQELKQEQVLPKMPWLKPQLVQDVVLKITSKLKGKFKLALAVRDSGPQNALSRSPLLDPDTQTVLRELSLTDDRDKQRRWSMIVRTFSRLTGCNLQPHPNFLRVMEEDLQLPIQYRGGGEQEFLFLLRLLTEEQPIFGIEEPELHSHPQLARQILDLLKHFSKEKQIFVTTHSTIFVDKADIESTWIVRKKGKETVIERVEEPTELRDLLFELGVRPSDIFFSDAIVFVEGETDRIVFPIWAEKIGVNLLSKVSIIPTYGKNRGKYYVNVWFEACKATNIPYFMIFDKGAEEDKEVKKFVSQNILVPNENLFILKKGSIEDYYPENKLIEAIKSEFNTEFSEDEKGKILTPPRAKNIESLLKEKGIDIRGDWKIRIGKKVAENMTSDEIDNEIKTIIERLRTKLQL